MAELVRRATWVLLGCVAVVLPAITDDTKVLTIAVFAFIVGGLASSWNILGGFAGQISLGHAAFFGCGALVTRKVWLGGGSLAVALASAVLVTAVVAVVVGAPMLRLRGIYFSIGTLAVAEAIRVTVGNLFPGISSLPVEALGDYDLGSRYGLALGVLVVTVAVSVWIRHSRLGLGMMAVREDEAAAAATGIDVFAHKLLAFVIASALAALVGGAYAYFSVSYYPSFVFGPVWTFDAILVAFIGGLGSIVGPIVGAAFFVIVRDTLASNLEELQVVVFGVIFILVVLLAPGGLAEVGRGLRVVFTKTGRRRKAGKGS